MEEIDILARTLYGEARGEYKRVDGGIVSLLAVASVIKNRSLRGGWFGQTIKEICLKPHQFSCWNVNDPNRSILEAVTMKDVIFQQCMVVAQKVMNYEWPDVTWGSDHYHANYVMPAWAIAQKPRFKIGCHLFYKLSR